MPVKRICKDCNVHMKRGPLVAEQGRQTIVISRFKVFHCPKCGEEELVDVKLERKR